jgi:1,4-alpha-glucan branching enzyme
MVELAKAHPEARGLLRRALNQASRELLLAQSSDWAFILTTGSVVPYAIRRIREHLHRFRNLRDQIRSGRFLEARLSDWEGRDNVFPEMDYRIYV